MITEDYSEYMLFALASLLFLSGLVAQKGTLRNVVPISFPRLPGRPFYTLRGSD